MTDVPNSQGNAVPPADAENPKVKPRKPWLAGLLAFLCQGLGHVYAGKGAVGIGLVVGPAFLFSIILGVSVATDTAVFGTAWFLVAVAAIIWVAQIVWAVRLARRAGRDYQLRRYNHILTYIAFVVGTSLVREAELLKRHVLETFKIRAISTIPALEIGDRIFVAKLGMRNLSPQRGDLIAFQCPEEPHDDYINRVVGLPGEEIAVQGGVVHINGEPLPRKELGVEEFWYRSEPSGRWYSFQATVFEEELGDITVRTLKDANEMLAAPSLGPMQIPEGHYFVMGDNRDRSYDSRSWGPVPAEKVIGRCHSIWFAWGKDGFRSDRIGKRL
jgi:signal peptidase I